MATRKGMTSIAGQLLAYGANSSRKDKVKTI